VDAVRQYLNASHIPVTWLEGARHAQFLANRRHFRTVLLTCAQLYETAICYTASLSPPTTAASSKASISLPTPTSH
jgi:hypothetical protein